MQNLGGQHAFIGGHVGGRLARHLVVLRRLDPARQSCHDRRCHLVLNLEYVIQLAVVLLGPDMGVIRGVDQLDRDPQAVARPAHTALDQVLRAQLLAQPRGRSPPGPL